MMHEIQESISWIVFPASVLLMVRYVSLVFRRWSTVALPLALTAAALVVCAVLGAPWVLWGAGWMTAIAVFRGRWRTPEAAIEHRNAKRARRLARRQATPYNAKTPGQVVDRAPELAMPEAPLVALAANPRVPADVRLLIERLEADCATAETYFEQASTTGSAPLTVRQIRTEYGPEAVKSYLNLPPQTADTEPVVGDKTGRVLVSEQLQLLIHTVDRQMRAAGEVAAEPMLANHRFLTDKFGDETRDLSL